MNQRPLPNILKQSGPVEQRKKRIRVSALMLKGNRVLLVKNIIDNREVWFLPGGSVDWGETLKEAILRESKEELGININVKNMIAITDSISPNKDFHSVDIIFFVEPEGDPVAKGECGGEKEITSNLYGIGSEWIDINQVKNIEAYPKKFLTDYLPQIYKNMGKSGVYLGNDWD